jgi:N-acetylglucosamine-6-phosphate deacetylase
MRVGSPGFVDLQVNGFAGVDFNTPGVVAADLPAAWAAMRSTGVTRCLPTLITSSLERFAACAPVIAACPDPMVVGIHLEGPYISPLDGPRGVHPRADVIPASWEDFSRRQDAAGGRIVLVTLAPEVPGALKLIEQLVARNIRVALGHTAADREQLRAAVAAGATLATHLGNGCAAVLPRHDNVIWEQLAADELSASLIVDGYHLPAAVVKAMVRAKGPGRSILVTDAVAAAHAPAGRYWLGGQEVERDAAGRVTLPGERQLAGSALTLDAAVANTVRFGACTLEEALAMASTNPARLLGIEPAGQVTAEWDSATGRLTIVAVTGS